MKTRLMLLALAGLTAFSTGMFAENPETEVKMVPKVIRLAGGGGEYLRVLGGPPETSTMHAGLVTLAAGKSVGKHSTKKYEELIVVLEGRGMMEIVGGPTLSFAKGEALYCPPNTEHNVTNNGEGDLIYLYVVAEARP